MRNGPARRAGSDRFACESTLTVPGLRPSGTTSVFPDSTRGSYVLPMKKKVRAAHDLDEGDPVDILLEVLE